MSDISNFHVSLSRYILLRKYAKRGSCPVRAFSVIHPDRTTFVSVGSMGEHHFLAASLLPTTRSEAFPSDLSALLPASTVFRSSVEFPSNPSALGAPEAARRAELGNCPHSVRFVTT